MAIGRAALPVQIGEGGEKGGEAGRAGQWRWRGRRAGVDGLDACARATCCFRALQVRESIGPSSAILSQRRQPLGFSSLQPSTYSTTPPPSPPPSTHLRHSVLNRIDPYAHSRNRAHLSPALFTISPVANCLSRCWSPSPNRRCCALPRGFPSTAWFATRELPRRFPIDGLVCSQVRAHGVLALSRRPRLLEVKAAS